ncbi:MAG TPA: histidine phosphatase family protein, partial [Cytophagales bacterium]|nr:histidine phosphatase family protein [Cytophagales bacterium]
MELFIIRHGETDYNLLGIVQGSRVNTDLNKTGLHQSTKFYEFYKDEGFEKVYTSKLNRSIQSVKAFIEMGIPWEQHEALNEINWGNTDGQKATVQEHAEYVETLKMWQEGKFENRMPGGESPMDVSLRQKVMVEKLKTDPYNKVLLCMHGRALRIFLCNLLDVSLTEMDNFEHSNLCLYRL